MRAVLALLLLAWLPMLPETLVERERAAGVLLDLAPMLVWVFGMARLPERWGQYGTRLASLWWTVLVVFEVARAAGRATTNVVLPLYDVVLLSRHLYILGRDLYPEYAPVALVVVGVLPLVVWFVGTVLFEAVLGRMRRWGWKGSTALLLVGLVGLFAGRSLEHSRFDTERLRTNIEESLEGYDQLERNIDRRQRVDTPTLTARPDLQVYIVESYGSVLGLEPYREGWLAGLRDLQASLASSGWYAATGWSRAPVHGGRSWIADAELLSSVAVAHQSRFQHLLTRLDDVPHLPRRLQEQGYDTVLVRPKDRARPGVKLVNHFGFDTTVFALDLSYAGPTVGWGEIPDQYTIDWVHEHVLARRTAPTFSFFHLATAHMPWPEAPPLLDDYLAWQTREASPDTKNAEERDLASLLELEFKRWRHGPGRKDKDALEGQAERYLDNVRYDLGAIERRLRVPPTRDTVVVVMGDHQPPMLAKDDGFFVPVHVLARSPERLAPLVQAGFTPGLLAERAKVSTRHRHLADLWMAALATADQEDSP